MNAAQIAAATRRRERRAAKAAHSAQQTELARKQRWERRLAKRRRRRAFVRTEPGSRTLVFRGPHTDFDFWMTWVVMGLMAMIPLLVPLAIFLPIWIVVAVAMLYICAALVRVFTPLCITVTDDGFFAVHRPYWPLPRGYGRVAKLELNLGRYYYAGVHDRYQKCRVESPGLHRFEARKLAPADVAVVEQFVAEMHRPRCKPAVDYGGRYRSEAVVDESLADDFDSDTPTLEQIMLSKRKGRASP